MEQKFFGEFNALALKITVLFAAMLLSLIVVAATGWVVIGRDAPADWSSPILLALAGATALLVPASHFMFQSFMQEEKLLAAYRAIGAHGVAARIQAAYLAGFAFSELIVLLGLVAMFFTGSREVLPPFLLVGVINHCLFFPSRERISSRARPLLRRARMTAESDDGR